MNAAENDFRIQISPLRGEQWRVTVCRLSDGMTKTRKCEGPWELAEGLVQGLIGELLTSPTGREEERK